jgi:hypothetical protein
VLSIADMDHRIQPDFGKAKIQGLVEQPALEEGYPQDRPGP